MSKKITEIAITSNRIKNKPMPLLLEPHESSYAGPPFLTMIQFRDQELLTVIDNIQDNQILCYVLDYCGPEEIDKLDLLAYAHRWWESEKNNMPFSIFLSKHDATPQFAALHRSLHVDFISRFVGPCAQFPMTVTTTKKRRKLRK